MMLPKIKKYLELIGLNKSPSKKDLLSSNEALKQFGKLWSDEFKGDVMMMISVIEQEYINNESFTEKEIVAVKRVLGQVALFFRGCKAEWDEYQRQQIKKVKG